MALSRKRIVHSYGYCSEDQLINSAAGSRGRIGWTAQQECFHCVRTVHLAWPYDADVVLLHGVIRMDFKSIICSRTETCSLPALSLYHRQQRFNFQV